MRYAHEINWIGPRGTLKEVWLPYGSRRRGSRRPARIRNTPAVADVREKTVCAVRAMVFKFSYIVKFNSVDFVATLTSSDERCQDET